MEDFKTWTFHPIDAQLLYEVSLLPLIYMFDLHVWFTSDDLILIISNVESSRVKDGDQNRRFANLLQMNKNSYWMFKSVCIISRHGSLWQSSNEFLATRRSLDHRNTKYRFCYSKKHAKYGGRMGTGRTI